MGLVDSTAALLLRIRGDSSHAVSEIKKVKKEAGDLKPEVDGATKSFAGLGSAATIAAAGLAVIGSGALAATAALFRLSKSAAEYGSAIFDASQKTGLGAETMSALKVAAEQSGSSFENITNAVARFNVLIGNAAAGNVKAEAILKQYGITATATQPALEQAITQIAGMASASDRAAAAAALFKDATGEILPVIESFDGDLPGLINKLRALGVLMSDEDAKAASEFTSQMKTLSLQLDAVTRAIGQDFMPVFLNMAQQVSAWLTVNKGEITNWSSNILAAFELIKTGASNLMINLTTLDNFLTTFFSGGTWQDYFDKNAAAAEGRVISAEQFGFAREQAGFEREMQRYRDEMKRLAGITGGGEFPEAGKAAKGIKDKLPKFDFTAEMRDYQKALRSLSPGLRDQILQYAEQYGIPTSLAFAQLFSESGFRTGVSSSQNAHGIGQLQPATASRALGRKVTKGDLFDVDTNLAAWGAEMARLFAKYGDWALAALAYHGGDGTADAFLKAQAGGSEALARFAKGNPKTARYAQKIPELSGLSKDELVGTVDIEKDRKQSVDNARQTMADILAIFESGQKRKLAIAQAYGAEVNLTDRQIADLQLDLETETLEKRKELLEKYIEFLKTKGVAGAEELRKSEIKLKLLEEDLEIQRAKNAEKEKRRWEERLERGATEAALAQRYFEEEQERQEERDRLLGLGGGGITLPDIDLSTIENITNLRPFDGWLESWENFANRIAEDMGIVGSLTETFGNQMAGLADILQQAFDQVANALGQVVSTWVLYGETGPAVMRKILASALATIAAEAAVRAIYALAAGFLFLAFGQFDKAAWAFISAGFWGSIAGVSAVAGRAVAGDSFKRETTAAAGRTTSTSSSAERDTSAQGGAYSSFGDKPYIQEEGRSAPLGVQVELSFKDKPAWFTQMFIAEWRANGRIRRLVEDGR